MERPPCSKVDIINITKILPRVVYRLNAIHIKISMACFVVTEENYRKIHIEAKGLREPKPQGSKRALLKKGTTIAAFKLHCRVMVTNTAWNWRQNRRINPWNRKVSNKYSYSHLILEKDAKICIREKTACSTSDARETGQPHIQKETRPPSHPVQIQFSMEQRSRH